MTTTNSLPIQGGQSHDLAALFVSGLRPADFLPLGKKRGRRGIFAPVRGSGFY